ncbi:MAG: hypothetical protein H7Y38_13410 [Armatimonadetes bacterium]|nr:hypothetical protein [Armatimonadota bacterium]
MGLAERRAAKAYQDDRYPLLLKQVQEAAQTEIPLEVKWDTLATDGYAGSYDETWTKVYFTPLIDALKSICRDDMGRDALREGVQKIVIQNTTGAYYGDRWSSLHDKTLTLDHEPVTNADNVKERTDGLIEVLEKNL